MFNAKHRMQHGVRSGCGCAQACVSPPTPAIARREDRRPRGEKGSLFGMRPIGPADLSEDDDPLGRDSYARFSWRHLICRDLSSKLPGPRYTVVQGAPLEVRFAWQPSGNLALLERPPRFSVQDKHGWRDLVGLCWSGGACATQEYWSTSRMAEIA